MLLLLTVSLSYGRQVRPNQQRIHAAKIAYITDYLHLSEEQSAKFIPVYNEYEKELRTIRQSYFKKYDISPDDDMAERRKIEDDLDYQQQVIELKRRYNDRFLKVISQQQVSDLYAAERAFMQVLINRLNRQGPRRGPMRGNN